RRFKARRQRTQVAVVLTAALVFAGSALVAGTASAGVTRTIVVGPGQSIQAAVDLASPGDTILVSPGTYTEAGQPCPTELTVRCAVVVNKDNIDLVEALGMRAGSW